MSCPRCGGIDHVLCSRRHLPRLICCLAPNHAGQHYYRRTDPVDRVTGDPVCASPIPRQTRMVRDPQKGRLYKAENAAFPNKKEDLDYEATVAYVAKVWASPWIRRHFRQAVRHPHPYVKDGRGTRIARGGLRRLNLPRWARNRPVILHEITHALLPPSEHHGWLFAKSFLALVQHFIGREAALVLKGAYRSYRVRYKKPRTMRPEVLAKLRERGRQLAAARRPPEVL